MIFHPKFTMLLLAVLTISLASAKDQPFGCLIHEAYGPDTYTLEEGAVSQSFQPCSTGELVYIHLFLNSQDESTFSAQMSISGMIDGESKTLTKQQIIVPENSKDPFASITLAQSITLQEGEEYWINIHANNQHPLNINYSSQNDYEEGSAFRNGVQTRGDLAFELGIRFSENPISKPFFKIKTDSNQCLDKIETGTANLEADFEHWNLHWSPCTNTSINSLGLQMITDQSSEGMLSVYKVTSLKKYIPIYDQQVTFEDLKNPWQILVLKETLDLEAGEKYYFEYQTFDPWKVAYTGNPNGHRESKYNYWINPLKFNSWEPFQNKEASCALYTEKVSSLHTSSDELLIQTFTTCTDGYLEKILIAGDLGKNEVIDWYVRDQNELIIDQGQITAKNHKKGVIQINLDLAVVNNTKYDLVLITSLEAKSVLYLAPASASLPAVTSDLNEIYHSLMIGFEYEELEIELIEEIQEELPKMSVYPNPFTEQFQANLSHIDKTCVLTLYDFAGNEVWKTQVEPSKDMTILANVNSNLPKGYYTLRLDYGNTVMLETLVKN